MLRENCVSHRKETSARNVPSNSNNLSIRDDLGSLNLNTSISKNPHRGENDENLKKEKPNRITNLKDFWEKTGQWDLGSAQESICVGPTNHRLARRESSAVMSSAQEFSELDEMKCYLIYLFFL